MAVGAARFGVRSSKQRRCSPPPLSFCAKVSLAALIPLSFVVAWSLLSSPSSTVSSRRDSFDDLPNPPHRLPISSPPPPPHPPPAAAAAASAASNGSSKPIESPPQQVETTETLGDREDEEHAQKKDKESDDDDAGAKNDEDVDDDVDVEDGVDVNPEEEGEEDGEKKKRRRRRRNKVIPPVFDPTVKYSWKLCGGRSKQNYVPCVDLEGSAGSSHRHRERSCPRAKISCLVPLPLEYRNPVPWPESETKIYYMNVAHPKLAAFVRTRKWLNASGDYLVFPRGESEFKGGVHHYLDSIEEMVPDVEWGKTVRVVLDIGCSDTSFGVTLLEKGALTLSFGLMNDQTDLAQLALERGYPAVLGNLGTRRLPFPSGVFDAIHCGECSISWHSNGGRLLVEMNRILRPGGYFIMSSKHGDIDSEEGMSKLTSSICWNILAHKTDEVSEVGVKIYQRPSSNEIYELRRRNEPPLCKENENQDVAWYVPIKICLHKVPEAIEQRGSDWPEEWPKRLEASPEWLGDLKEKLTKDNGHWKAIISKSYLNGMGIDWSKIRNVMDMKAIYGGFAAALASQNVWVMNVVPVHAPNTLPIIYERGLVGIYHDWCEPFSTYPRSYDLLHADHLFSRLKGRCKQPIVIVVEMDRILRPGGWAIIRDKLEILNPLETILKMLQWEIRMTYGKDKEGIICVQKTGWRP